MHEQTEPVPAVVERREGDVDSSGKLAMSLFVAIIALMLMLIYAIATAA